MKNFMPFALIIGIIIISKKKKVLTKTETKSKYNSSKLVSIGI